MLIDGFKIISYNLNLVNYKMIVFTIVLSLKMKGHSNQNIIDQDKLPCKSIYSNTSKYMQVYGHK